MTSDTPVLIVGRGPVGMTLGLLLARLGVRSTIVDRAGGEIPPMSKAVVVQRESAEVLGRAGIGHELAARGVTLTGSRTYVGEHELLHAEIAPPDLGAFPLLLNFPQSETEQLLLARVDAEPLIDVRLEAPLTRLELDESGVLASCEDGAGGFQIRAEYVAGCDGSRSTVRKQLPIAFTGHAHNDHYLIVDIRAQLPLPDERRFWFDPPSNRRRTILVHPQHDSHWHIDFQVGDAPDLERERRSGRLDERIRAVIGPELDYAIVSMTTYVFKQLIADSFSVGRAFLVGDAAHLYAPYGARGLNSGLADADNLAWKLASVLHGDAPPALLDSYDLERRAVAQEHFRVTSDTARFMAPTTRRGRLRRDLTLAAARQVPSLRRFVNSGRFYEPLGYPHSPIVQPGHTAAGGPRAGDVMPDLPLRALATGGDRTTPPARLRDLVGDGFLLVHIAPDAAAGAAVRDVLQRSTETAATTTALTVLTVLPRGAGATATTTGSATLAEDRLGHAPERTAPDGLPSAGRMFLVRPDCHIASRHDLHDAAAAAQAGAWLRHALGHGGTTAAPRAAGAVR